MMTRGLSILAVVNLMVLAFPSAGLSQGGAAPGGLTPRAEVRQIKVQPDLAPDCSSLKAIVESVTRGCANNDEKAVAIYNFMILSHYHLQYPSEKGLSALKEINVYGWSLCGGLHSVQSALWRELGWKWRFVGWSKPGHTTVEAEYDGTWHYLDAFLKYYAWMPDPKAPGGRRIAGQDDLQKDSKGLITDALVFDNARKVWYAKDNVFSRLGDGVNWTAPAFLVCADMPEGVISGVNSRGSKGSPEAWAGIQHATGGYSTDINLAPGFSLTSTWNPVSNAWYWANGKKAPSHGCNNKDFRNSPENGPVLEPYLMPGRDRRSYANGMLVFRPDLSSEDVLESFAAVENVKAESGTLVPADPGKPASVVVALQSPYPMTLASGEAGGIEKAEISTDGGKQWKDVALQDFGEAVKGAYSALLKLTFRAAVEELRVEATVQNNPCALPYLSPGRNVVRVSVGDKGALGGNRLVVTYAFCPGSRSKTYEQLLDAGQEIAKAHGATWSEKPVYVRREFLAKDLSGEFEINIPTPKGKQAVYPRMVFVRREVLAPGAEPLPLPEGAVEFKPDPAGELKSLPNPFRIGTTVPSKPVPREVVTRTLELRASHAVSLKGETAPNHFIKWIPAETWVILAGGKLDKLPPAGDIGAARLVIPVIRGKNEAAVKLGAAPLKAPFEAGKAYDFANIGDVAGTVVVPKQPDGKDYAPPREFKVDVTRAVKAVAGGEPFHGFAIRTLQDRGVDEGVYTRVDIPTAAKIGLELDVYSMPAASAAKP